MKSRKAVKLETIPRTTIMALDVGFRNMGVVIFDPVSDQPIAVRTIKTEPSHKKLQVRKADDNSRRAAEMARELSDMIDRYNVRGAVGELPSGGSKSHAAATQMAAATAVAAAVLELKGIPTEWSTPTEGKVALCGSKTASKEEMMAKARELYGDMIDLPKAKAEFEHIADAMAAYLAQKNGNIKRLLS
jgi:Holliday junction resolvasome RuvABC endonuclease subunit